MGKWLIEHESQKLVTARWHRFENLDTDVWAGVVGWRAGLGPGVWTGRGGEETTDADISSQNPSHS